ncbi:AMMECR1 domain-containing protein, partial [Megasphaera massiliensis]
HLVYHVDVLCEPEQITSFAQLDVKRYGIIVSDAYHQGVLLPDLEGVDTIQQQVAIALHKAGIDENASY